MPTIPTITSFESLTGPALLNAARFIAHREAAVAEASRRLTNGSTSRFPKAVVAKYAAKVTTPAQAVAAENVAAAEVTPEDAIEALRVQARRVARKSAEVLARKAKAANPGEVNFVLAKIAQEADLVGEVNEADADMLALIIEGEAVVDQALAAARAAHRAAITA